MTPAATRRAADIIAEARLARRPLGTLPDDCRPADEAEGYAVQAALHERLDAAGLGPRAGYKIGCTTPVMQERLGIDSPCGGGVLAGNVHHGSATLACADFVKPGAECEIAVRLGADLPAAGAPYDRESVAGAVEACMAAIELVDNRYVEFRELGVPTLIADDFFNVGCVLGEPLSDWRALDLGAVAGRTVVNGAEVGRGVGADVLGHPFAALAWLANTLAALGRGLEAGAFVLTGSMVAAHQAEPGEDVAMVIDGLGDVHALYR